MNHRKLSAVVLCSVVLVCRGLVSAADGTGTFDVTNAVRQAVQNNSLTLVVNNDVYGDPAPTVVKKLKVEYTLNGVANTKVLVEYSTLSIHPPKGVKLAITKATYGDLPNEHAIDVTSVLTGAIQSDKISLPVNNEAFHVDPASGVGKKLEVNYTVGGKPGKATVGEGETLTLPQPGEGAGNLVIVSATYGAF